VLSIRYSFFFFFYDCFYQNRKQRARIIIICGFVYKPHTHGDSGKSCFLNKILSNYYPTSRTILLFIVLIFFRCIHPSVLEIQFCNLCVRVLIVFLWCILVKDFFFFLSAVTMFILRLLYSYDLRASMALDW